MKRTATIFGLILCFTSVSHPGLRAQAPPKAPPAAEKALPSLTGKWAVQLNSAMGQSTPTLTLAQNGEKLTGTYAGRYGSFPLEGTLKGRAIQFWFTMSVEGEKVEMSFTGEVAADGQSMRGDADLGQAGDGSWSASRAADKS
jgi:hypothetical protein